MSDPRAIDPEELRQRAVYSLFRPTVRLARRFRVPLKRLAHWLQIAYFHELRQQGLTLKEIADRLDVGMRKAAELSRQMKGQFFRPEFEHGLPRRIEFMLWAESLSRARIHQLMRTEGIDEDEVEAAIERLLAERRIRPVEGKKDVLTVTSTRARLVSPSWMARIDGLNTLVANLGRVTEDRVLNQRPTALLRTLSFRLRPEDVVELRDVYETVLFPRLAELEERASERTDALTMSLSILWAVEEDDEQLEGDSEA